MIFEAYRSSRERGYFTINSMALFGLVAANMAIAGGRFEAARTVLGEVQAEAQGPAENFAGAAILNDTWLAHRVGEERRRNALLGETLRKASDSRVRERIKWYPNALSELLPIALIEGIEPQMARELARELNVIPSGPVPENWPWPVKVYALGPFRLLINDKPLEFSRKAPKKVLLLLKAIVAFGGEAVAEQKLIDALWPEEEGDAARRALSITVHRLRTLLGHAQAVRQSGGMIGVDRRLCWVDAFAFEGRVDELNGESEPVEAVLDLYRGTFLSEDDAPWMLATRERLRTKFTHVVARVGQAREASGRYEKALDLYRRGIEADNLVEAFYQGLMRCYERLNRRAEALSTYRRLREVLSVTLGVTPSSGSQRLFDAMRQG